MQNLSQKKRQRMFDFLEKIKSMHREDEKALIAIGEIENELIEKKYGLVWEKYVEKVDEDIKNNVPVFKEIKDKSIKAGEDDTCNFLLEGDNLHSLKLLEKTHKNKIDVIYIDPPYNRGKNDFVYDDKFINSDDAFKHSKWLSFIYERLVIAKKLLNKNGAIFISIDDNEQAPLKMLCDEIFGSNNFLGIIIQNKQNSKNDSIDIQKNHEYIIVYRKQCNYISKTKISPTLRKKDYVTKKIFEENGRYYYLNDQITTRGEGGTLNKRKNLGYTIYYNPDTDDKLAIMDYDVNLVGSSEREEEIYTTKKDLIEKGYVAIRAPRVRGQLGCWTWELNKFNMNKDYIKITKNIRNNKYIVKKRTFVDKNDVYENNGKLYYDLSKFSNVKSIVNYSTNDGSKELANILGKVGTFDNPKNLDMIKYLIELIPNKNATVLDFFAGSGTTGQAVLELNKQDGGKRHFILCTNNQNDICEKITYQRIKNRIQGYTINGKKSYKLYEQKINLSTLNNIDNVLEDFYSVIEKGEQEYAEIDSGLKNNTLYVIGNDIEKQKISGIPANLKYYRTEMIEKTKDEEFYSVGEELEKYIKEMIQLERGVTLETGKYILILNDEDAKNLEENVELLDICEVAYINCAVFLSEKQQEILSGIDIITIPNYYFEEELREVGEL